MILCYCLNLCQDFVLHSQEQMFLHIWANRLNCMGMACHHLRPSPSLMASHGCQGSHISDDDGANDEEPARWPTCRLKSKASKTNLWKKRIIWLNLDGNLKFGGIMTNLFWSSCSPTDPDSWVLHWQLQWQKISNDLVLVLVVCVEVHLFFINVRFHYDNILKLVGHTAIYSVIGFFWHTGMV